MQVSMVKYNVKWKLLHLLADDWKDNNAPAPELLSLGSCSIQVPAVLDKSALFNNFFSIFRKAPARRAD